MASTALADASSPLPLIAAEPEKLSCGRYEIIGKLFQNTHPGEPPGVLVLYPETTRHSKLKIIEGEWTLLKKYDQLISKYQVFITREGKPHQALAILQKAGPPLSLDAALSQKALSLIQSAPCPSQVDSKGRHN